MRLANFFVFQIHRLLNAEKKCMLQSCRARKLAEAKVEVRPPDFKALGLNYSKGQYLCVKHYTHGQPHLANQKDDFFENGQLSEGAVLKKIYSKRSFRAKRFQIRPNHLLPDSFRVGCYTEILSVEADHGEVGHMQVLEEEFEEKPDTDVNVLRRLSNNQLCLIQLGINYLHLFVCSHFNLCV